MSSTGAAGAWSYRVGPWFAAFGPRVTVLLPESQRDQVVGVWSLVDGGAGFDDVLDALLASGLSRLPGFVLVSTDEGPTRVLLRGAGVSAILKSDADEVAIDGSASGTWVERSVDGVTSLSVALAADDADESSEAGAEQPATDFTVVTGLVRVSRIDRPPYVEPAAAEPAAAEEPAAAAVADVPADEGTPESLDLSAGLPADLSADAEPTPLADDAAPAELADVAESAEASPVLAGDEPAIDEPAVAVAEESSPLDEAAPFEDSMAVDNAPAPLDEPALMDEPGPFAAASAEPELEMPTDGDPLTDPMPPAPTPAPAPTDWVTPWDSPPPAPEAPGVPEAPGSSESSESSEPSEPAMADEPGGLTEEMPAPGADPMVDNAPAPAGETEVAPSPYAPPPPAGDAPGVDLPPPPLPVGSWEPVGGPPLPPPAESPAAPAADSGMVDAPSAAPASDAVAKLMISDGQQVLVDRVILIGRAPEARRFTSTEQPHLVTVPSRLHEISSTHVEVRPGTGADQGAAVVTDMGSTNGTVLVQPGLGPEDLKPGIAVQLVPGAIINLGDGVTIQVTRP
ncbi:hypothetical protein DJ010_04115 [Nocardioides silvaticus]|uniref:FHA domain-containing protein n=2 Tax=Nocardioides silvaticus TaxID=2201891 RepID=A0A316TRE1_9ACTN|nr:hypothetical protein DJ010_04115 [Nocardioides silvaticus]